MAQYYVKHLGQKLYKASKSEISKLARELANETGIGVPVYVDGKRAGSAHREAPFVRNPIMQGRDYTGEEYKVVGWKGNKSITAYANSKADAANEKRLLAAQGWGMILVRQTAKALGERKMTRNPSSPVREFKNRKVPVMLTIYNQGRADKKAGWLISDCPYIGAPKEKAMWLKGYRATK